MRSTKLYWRPGLDLRTTRKTHEHIPKTMQVSDLADHLEEEIQAAELVDVPEGGEEEEDFGDIVESIVRGDATVEEIEDRVVSWVNERVDIPFVPEEIEEKMFEMVSSLLRKAAVEVARRIA